MAGMTRNARRARRGGRAQRGDNSPRLRLCALAVVQAFAAGAAFAAPPLPPGTLPNAVFNNGVRTVTPPSVVSGTASYTVTGNSGVINQATPRAIIQWNTFNIAADSSVHF